MFQNSRIKNISEECFEIDESEEEMNDSFQSDHKFDSNDKNYSSRWQYGLNIVPIM